MAASLDCPVLLVHAGGGEARFEPMRRLIVAVEAQPEAEAAVMRIEALPGVVGVEDHLRAVV